VEVEGAVGIGGTVLLESDFPQVDLVVLETCELCGLVLVGLQRVDQELLAVLRNESFGDPRL
jgi:hypothetical protein